MSNTRRILAALALAAAALGITGTAAQAAPQVDAQVATPRHSVVAMHWDW